MYENFQKKKRKVKNITSEVKNCERVLVSYTTYQYTYKKKGSKEHEEKNNDINFESNRFFTWVFLLLKCIYWIA